MLSKDSEGRLKSCSAAFALRFDLGDDARKVFEKSVRELVEMEIKKLTKVRRARGKK